MLFGVQGMAKRERIDSVCLGNNLGEAKVS